MFNTIEYGSFVKTSTDQKSSFIIYATALSTWACPIWIFISPKGDSQTDKGNVYTLTYIPKLYE